MYKLFQHTVKHTAIDNSEDTLMELSLEENFTENREQFLDDGVDEIMDYVFGEYPLCEEHEDSSEVEDSIEVRKYSLHISHHCCCYPCTWMISDLWCRWKDYLVEPGCVVF